MCLISCFSHCCHWVPPDVQHAFVVLACKSALRTKSARVSIGPLDAVVLSHKRIMRPLKESEEDKDRWERVAAFFGAR